MFRLELVGPEAVFGDLKSILSLQSWSYKAASIFSQRSIFEFLGSKIPGPKPISMEKFGL